MNRATLALTLIFALLFSAVIVTQFTNSVAAQTYSTITIKADGSIEGTDRIQRQGNVYTLTGDISGDIRVKKSYIERWFAGLLQETPQGLCRFIE